MTLRIKFGGTCRDVDQLPSSEGELREFFMNELVPAMWTDFSKNVTVARGPGMRDREVNVAITERGCTVGGEIIFTF